MKSNKVDPEIKTIVEQHTGSIGAWGPTELYVEMRDLNLTNDLIELMKSRGWHLIEEDSDDKNLFFHFGVLEKAVEKEIAVTEVPDLSGKDTWSSSLAQKTIVFGLIALFGFMAYRFWFSPRIASFRYPTLSQIIVIGFFALLTYRWLNMVLWKLKIEGADIIIQGLFRNTTIRMDQVKRISNEKSQYWARTVVILLRNGKEISCQGISHSDANELTSLLKTLKASQK